MRIKTEVAQFKRPDFEKNLAEAVGYKPNSWQHKVHASDARFKVICAGRRSGKSHYVTHDTRDGLVTDLVLPEQWVWVVAPNYDLTQRVWADLYNLAIAKFKPIIQRIHNTKGNFKIETAFGTIIEAKSAEEADKLVGAGLTKIIVDEAAMVNPKAWNQSLRPTLIDHKGKAMFISTPKGKNWFWDLWMKGQKREDGEWESWRFSSFDNDHLDRKELDKIVKDMPEFEYRQEILAEFEETAEQVFRNIKAQAIGLLAEPKRGHRYQMGVDLGRKSSYTVIVVVDESEYPHPVVYMDRFRRVDWDMQKLRIRKAWDSYPCLRVQLDATGIGDPLVEDLERDGVRIEPFIFTENSKKQLIDKLSIFIEDGRLIYPNDAHLIKELDGYGREISKSGRIKYKALGNTTDDAVHALALAVWPLPHKSRRIVGEQLVKRKGRPLSVITGY